MNWKYNNQEEEVEGGASGADIAAMLMAAGGGPSASYGGGGNTIRTVENTIYFYGDITESNALDLNSTLHAVDKKLSLSSQFLDVTPIIIGTVVSIIMVSSAQKINQQGNASIKSAVDSHNAGLKEKISFQFGGTSNGIGLVGYF